MNAGTASKKKFLLAVGGTGGHLLPAQALAKELMSQNCEIFFCGGKLGSNPFFHKQNFPFREISGASPFRGNPLSAGMQLWRGWRESLALIDDIQPDSIIGFGSFYSFPTLLAAKQRKIPYILVESNALPGKVNRLFSKGGVFTAVQFLEAKKKLKGDVLHSHIPFWSTPSLSSSMSRADARKYFELKPDRFTLLIFGGSQGARILNQIASFLEDDLQVLHFCGKGYDDKAIRATYDSKQIHACVKPFEENMRLAYLAADLALTRAGGSTINELIDYQVPAILVPWPGASENHQYQNACGFVAMGGGMLLEERNILSFPALLKEARGKIDQFRLAMDHQKKNTPEPLINQILERL